MDHQTSDLIQVNWICMLVDYGIVAVRSTGNPKRFITSSAMADVPVMPFAQLAATTRVRNLTASGQSTDPDERGKLNPMRRSGVWHVQQYHSSEHGQAWARSSPVRTHRAAEVNGARGRSTTKSRGSGLS